MIFQDKDCERELELVIVGLSEGGIEVDCKLTNRFFKQQ